MPEKINPAQAARERENQRIGGEVVRLLDGLLQRATDSRASDLHIEPKEHMIRVRFRVDGVMVEQRPLPTSYAAPLLSRIKVVAQMDIADKRIPQDGTFTFTTREQDNIAVRAATFPCVHGEKAVLRLMHGGQVMSLAELGVATDQELALRRMAWRPGGLVVVTGPTGSGKTSTLYALLEEVDAERRNVVTLEDPIEVPLPNITQGQINPKAGFTWDRGLRALLRQDPDVILVGEMRDTETAQTAVQASLTGHLVLSTIHTNSSVETMIRLIDMGMEPYIVSNALIGVVAQRLVRTLCRFCAVPGPPYEEDLEDLGFEIGDLPGSMRAVGCPECMGTGFLGRTGIFDVVPVDDDLRNVLKRNGQVHDIKMVLRDKGLPTLRRAGVDLVAAGSTTLGEVIRVT